ncbi:MAG: S8 family peptidase [Clostridiales bacterium]|jgi:subtilisin family serine protease|nr:S8 family peptidase [Clostridiales bacterium]
MSPESIAEFSLRADAMTFVVRDAEAARAYAEGKPDIYVSKTLSGGFGVLYVLASASERVLADLGMQPVLYLAPIVGLLGAAELDAAQITPLQTQPYVKLRGEGTLLAFVDTGIDYTLPAFRYEDGTTRIRYLWDQTVAGTPPDGYLLGREFSEVELNEALDRPDPFAAVPSRDELGHGTFLASVAGSRETGDYIGGAPDAEFIIVKLKPASAAYRTQYLTPPEAEGVYEAASLVLGIAYVLEKAHELGMPVSFCLSVGNNLGSHDGYGIVEEYLSLVSHTSGVALSVATGNENTLRHHAQGVVDVGTPQEVEIVVEEGSYSFPVTVWSNATDRLSVSVRSPTGEVVPRVPAQSGVTLVTHLLFEPSTVTVSYTFPITGNGSQLTSVRIVDPTPGIWTITVYGDVVLDGTFDAYLPAGGMVSPGVVFIRPSPDGTESSISTASGAVACAAYDAKTNSLYAYSSWGPTRGGGIAPDLAAPGVDVAGIYPGDARGTMSGTSVAAAITAAAAALMLEWGIVRGNESNMNTYLIKANLIRGCTRDAGTTYPNVRWGYGKLNLLDSFRLMRGFTG